MGVIFDLDGTLIDSMEVWTMADEVLLSRYGYVPDEEYNKNIVTLSFLEGVRYIIEKFNIKRSYSEIRDELWAIAFNEYNCTVRLKAGVRDMLRCLKAYNISLAVATSCMPGMCEAVLRNNGIYDYFDAFSYSDVIGKNKSFPDVYLNAAKDINAEAKRCVVFEDSYSAAKTAQKAGFHVIGVFDPFYINETKRLKTEFDGYIDSFSNFDADNFIKWHDSLQLLD